MMSIKSLHLLRLLVNHKTKRSKILRLTMLSKLMKLTLLSKLIKLTLLSKLIN